MGDPLQFVLLLLSSAVVVKLLDLAYDALKQRRASRDKTRAAQLLDSVENRRLSLDEISLVVRTQQEEIKRLNGVIAEQAQEIRTLHADMRGLREEAERTRSAHDEQYGSLAENYRNLQEKYKGVLRLLLAYEGVTLDG